MEFNVLKSNFTFTILKAVSQGIHWVIRGEQRNSIAAQLCIPYWDGTGPTVAHHLHKQLLRAEAATPGTEQRIIQNLSAHLFKACQVSLGTAGIFTPMPSRSSSLCVHVGLCELCHAFVHHQRSEMLLRELGLSVPQAVPPRAGPSPILCRMPGACIASSSLGSVIVLAWSDLAVTTKLAHTWRCGLPSPCDLPALFTASW